MHNDNLRGQRLGDELIKYISLRNSFSVETDFWQIAESNLTYWDSVNWTVTVQTVSTEEIKSAQEVVI